MQIPVLGTFADTRLGDICRYPCWGTYADTRFGDICSYPCWGHMQIPVLGTYADTRFGDICRYPFWGHMQKVQIQLRRRNMRRLIRVFAVCFQEFLCSKSENIHQETPKTTNGLIEMIRVDTSTGQKMVKPLSFGCVNIIDIEGMHYEGPFLF